MCSPSLGLWVKVASMHEFIDHPFSIHTWDNHLLYTVIIAIFTDVYLKQRTTVILHRDNHGTRDMAVLPMYVLTPEYM